MTIINAIGTSETDRPESRIIKVLAARTPEETLAENEAQEFDGLTRVIAAVVKILPNAEVDVRHCHVARRSACFGCTARYIQYIAVIHLDKREISTLAGTLDSLLAAVVTKARDIATERKLAAEHGAFDAAHAPERFPFEHQ